MIIDVSKGPKYAFAVALPLTLPHGCLQCCHKNGINNSPTSLLRYCFKDSDIMCWYPRYFDNGVNLSAIFWAFCFRLMNFFESWLKSAGLGTTLFSISFCEVWKNISYISDLGRWLLIKCQKNHKKVQWANKSQINKFTKKSSLQ